MVIFINKTPVEFTQRAAENLWWGTYVKGSLNVEVQFHKEIFDPSGEEIYWRGIELVFSEILSRWDTLIQKSTNILKALHKEIFEDQFEKYNCYFDLTCLELTELTRYDGFTELTRFSFSIIFSLESETNPYVDMYAQYEAKFRCIIPHVIVLIGAIRE